MTWLNNLRGWKFYCIAGVTALLAVFPRRYFFAVPFDRDEGVYAYVADTIQQGGLPYLHAFDHKFPLIHYFYQLSFHFFGHSVTAPRILATVFVAIAVMLVFALVYRITRSVPASIFSALLLGLASSSPAYTGFSVNTEILTLPFMAGGLILLADEDPPPASFFFAGVLFGIGVLVKQPVVAVCAALLTLHAVRMRQQPVQLLQCMGLAVLGGLLPLGATILYFASQGGLQAFWQCCFTYNLGYLAGIGYQESFHWLIKTLRIILILDPALWLAGGLGVLFWAGSAIRPFYKAYTTAGLIGAALATAMGKHFYAHYFVYLLPFLAVSAGMALAALSDKRGSRFALIGGALLILGAYGQIARFAFMPVKDLIMGSYGDISSLQSRTIGEYLRTNTKPGSSVFILGSESQIFFFSGLRAVSRIHYFYPLTTPNLMNGELRKEVLRDLISHPPDFVILVNQERSLGLSAVGDDIFLKTLFDLFSAYRLTGVIADSTETLIDADNHTMRTIAGKGGGMLLLSRPTDNLSGRLTFGDLLGQKAGN